MSDKTFDDAISLAVRAICPHCAANVLAITLGTGRPYTHYVDRKLHLCHANAIWQAADELARTEREMAEIVERKRNDVPRETL